MPDLNGVQVTIVCNDHPLEEYEVTYEGDTATCWIPSEASEVRESTQTLPLSVDRRRSSFGRGILRGGEVLTIFYDSRPSRFGGELTLDYPYITSTGFSTATWTDEA